jgi:hypothetical protein
MPTITAAAAVLAAAAAAASLSRAAHVMDHINMHHGWYTDGAKECVPLLAI